MSIISKARERFEAERTGRPVDRENPVEPILAAARQAQAAWADVPVRARLKAVARLRALIVERAAEIVAAVETHRPRSPGETLMAEVLPVAAACRFLEKRAEELLRPRRIRTWAPPLWLAGLRCEVRRDPFGVALIIAPWNYPFLLPGVQMIQALVAGNAAVVKPAADSRAPVALLAGLMEEAGLDRRLFPVLDESVDAARDAVEAGVDKVVLTGSAETGRAVLQKLAPKLAPAAMELSGCDAAFVREDADLDRVVSALVFGMRFNAGATCIGPHRVLVARPRAEALERRLAEAVATVAACAVRQSIAERVKRLVDEAIDAGARRVMGQIRPGEFFEPVVLADMRPDMAIMQADLFAPVLLLTPVADDAEALAFDAQCPFALGATVFGKLPAARRLAERVQAGSVTVNDMLLPTAHPELPFGGRRGSGFGTTRGAEGLLEMTTLKSLAVRRGRCLHLRAPAPEDALFAEHYLTAAYGQGWLRRLRSFWEAMRYLKR